MKKLYNYITEKFKINSEKHKGINEETVYVSNNGDIQIEVGTEETSNNIVRIIYKDKKMVKYWFDQDTLQTSFVESSCDIINEYNNIFK